MYSAPISELKVHTARAVNVMHISFLGAVYCSPLLKTRREECAAGVLVECTANVLHAPAVPWCAEQLPTFSTNCQFFGTSMPPWYISSTYHACSNTWTYGQGTSHLLSSVGKVMRARVIPSEFGTEFEWHVRGWSNRYWLALCGFSTRGIIHLREPAKCNVILKTHSIIFNCTVIEWDYLLL